MVKQKDGAEEQARAICHYSRLLVERGLMAGLSGNLSVRLSGGLILMTPAGGRKDEYAPADLALVDLTGRPLRGSTAMSSEGHMHLAIYRMRPDVGAVVHAHPPVATALGIAEREPCLDITAEGAAFVGAVKTVPWILPGSAELASAVGDAAAGCNAMILRHHGAVCLGCHLSEAVSRMESLEHVSRVYQAALALGMVRTLPDPDVARLRPSEPG